MTSQTLYDILGILEDASPEEIKAAYRRKMSYVHPDRGGSEEAATQINAAYDVLFDAQQRADYDASRRGGAIHCPICDEGVHSDDELLGHSIRHRAEVEAAQAVIAHEAVRQVQHASQAPESSRTPRRDGNKQVYPAASRSKSETSRTSRLKSITVSWGVAIALVLIVVVVVAALAAFSLNRRTVDESAASPSSTVTETTVRVSISTTTFGDIEIMGATWPLPDYDGSILFSGSVGPAPPADRAEWFWDYEYPDDNSLELQYLLFDNETMYDVVDYLCAAPDCETYLTYMLDGEELVWIVDAVDGGGDIVLLSDTLHFVTTNVADSVAVCWSNIYDGPVVSILRGGVEPPVVDHAWVFQGELTTGTWIGLESTRIDPTSTAIPPFSSVDRQIPACIGLVG